MPKKLNSKKLHKLKYWRGVLGLTQENMGVLLGYSKANYSQKESGAIEFTLREAKNIQREFNKRLAKMGQPILTLDDIFLV